MTGQPRTRLERIRASVGIASLALQQIDESARGWTDWELAREVVYHAQFPDGEQRINTLFTEVEVRRVTEYLAGSRPDTERLTAIEICLQSVPDGWRQRDGDAGRIEDADAQWLAQQLRQAWARLDRLRDRLDAAGSLMDTTHVATAIDYVPGSRETE
ncbi:hypothetical protein [Streptomyces sp. AC627_RSS907]|uniref:hypothetical protein n=1 Tax=Streptomyces sp. AC627_RSS907 TaxID=2823684 RepID=UPI001C227109|nr:hypothetical protein [Streptomyces sp. AC627_RSS907]